MPTIKAYPFPPCLVFCPNAAACRPLPKAAQAPPAKQNADKPRLYASGSTSLTPF